jgi:hypothetical protein
VIRRPNKDGSIAEFPPERPTGTRHLRLEIKAKVAFLDAHNRVVNHKIEHAVSMHFALVGNLAGPLRLAPMKLQKICRLAM